MPIVNVLLLFTGFVILIYGAGKLVNGASALAKRYNIPDIVIGLTIVAFGTSAPEMAINIVAALNGNTDIVLGNVLGSNIFNVMAILGIAAMIAPLTVKKETLKWEIPLSLIAAIMVLLVAADHWFGKDETKIGFYDSLILIAFFGLFLYYNFRLAKSYKDEFLSIESHQFPVWKSLLFIVGGLAGLIIGGRLIVDNSIKLATLLGVSERVIALTIVSIGTSLPELATSVVAVRKKEVDIAIGNVVGSNIFNIFLVLGISALINTTAVPRASFFDIGVNIGAGVLLLLFVFMSKDKNKPGWEGHFLSRWQGIIFTLLYVGYLIYLIVGR